MSWAIWITGAPGRATSSLARTAAIDLADADAPVVCLELDTIRDLVAPAPTGTAFERDLIDRALVFIAKTLVAAGGPVIVNATGSRRASHDLARVSIPTFAEVEVPGEPDEVARIVELARDLESRAPRYRKRHHPGWAVWITGLPGSGKSTVASGLVEQLAGREIEAHLLTFSELRRFVLGECPRTPSLDDLLHRALVSTAAALTTAGVPVVIDATAERRAWRDLARAHVPHFAEIQLLCPPDVCSMREQRTRWASAQCVDASPPRGLDEPDTTLGYEVALAPELIVRTDILSRWSAIEETLRVAHRLHHVFLVHHP